MILSSKGHGEPAESFPDTPRNGPLRLLTRLHLLKRNWRPPRTRIAAIFSLRSAPPHPRDADSTAAVVRWKEATGREHGPVASETRVANRAGKKGRVCNGER